MEGRWAGVMCPLHQVMTLWPSTFTYGSKREFPVLESDDEGISGFSVVGVIPQECLTTATEASALTHQPPYWCCESWTLIQSVENKGSHRLGKETKIIFRAR